MCQDDSRTPTNYHKLIMAKARLCPFGRRPLPQRWRAARRYSSPLTATPFVQFWNSWREFQTMILQAWKLRTFQQNLREISACALLPAWPACSARYCSPWTVRLGNPHRKAADVQNWIRTRTGCGQRHKATPQGTCRLAVTEKPILASLRQQNAARSSSRSPAMRQLHLWSSESIWVPLRCLDLFSTTYPTLFCSSLQACHGLPTFILWVYGCWMFILYLRMFLL